MKCQRLYSGRDRRCSGNILMQKPRHGESRHARRTAKVTLKADRMLSEERGQRRTIQRCRNKSCRHPSCTTCDRDGRGRFSQAGGRLAHARVCHMVGASEANVAPRCTNRKILGTSLVPMPPASRPGGTSFGRLTPSKSLIGVETRESQTVADRTS